MELFKTFNEYIILNFKISLIYYLLIYVCVHECLCYSECVEVRGQLVGISSLLHHVVLGIGLTWSAVGANTFTCCAASLAP